MEKLTGGGHWKEVAAEGGRLRRGVCANAATFGSEPSDRYQLTRQQTSDMKVSGASSHAMSLMRWTERLRRGCRLGICSAPSAIRSARRVSRSCVRAVCASARQSRWRSVPLTGRTRCCGSSERATSSDWLHCHSRCSMTWAACHQGSCQVIARQVQGATAGKHPDLIIPDAVWRTRWTPQITVWHAGEQAVLDYLARCVSPIMAHFQPKLAVIP